MLYCVYCFTAGTLGTGKLYSMVEYTPPSVETKRGVNIGFGFHPH